MNEQFLPSFIPYYPSNEYLTSSAFNSVLTSKQEFRDLELEKAESYPSKKGRSNEASRIDCEIHVESYFI